MPGYQALFVETPHRISRLSNRPDNVAVICECYVRGISTRRVDGLVKTPGMEGVSKSQVSALAKTLDTEVAAFQSRPLDGAAILRALGVVG